MKINWTVRFKNRAFVTRFALALVLPILAYFGIKFEDLTSWGAVFGLLGKFASNPYLVGLTVFNALNIVPDPTTTGLGDSTRALGYEEPSED